MININFFEKKKKDVTPFILILVTIIALTVLSGYFYWMSDTLANEETNKLNQIEQQRQVVLELQRVNLIENQVVQLENDANQLSEKKYPTHDLYQLIIAQIPAGDDNVLNTYNFTAPSNIQMTLELSNEQDVGILYQNLLRLSFIEHLSLESIIIDLELDTYELSYSLLIDYDTLIEVTSHDN